MTATSTIGANARIANPARAPLAFLIGEWRTTGTHPMMGDRLLAGRTRFAWHQGGAFLIMHNEVDAPGFPDGVAIFGSDDGAGSITMIYFDERGVSRHFAVEAGERTVSWHRADAKLSQSLTISADGEDRMVSEGRMSQDGGPWTDDLSQTFERS